MNIEYWRTEIDEVDRDCCDFGTDGRGCDQVGALKRVAGLPCNDPERERVVLNTLRRAHTGPLDSRASYKLFRRIIANRGD